MRDHKYRAWDKERKKFLTGSKWATYSVDLAGNLTAKNYDFHGIEQNLELVEFTGLKDKNGKEIYEGDIIKWSSAIKDAPLTIVKSWEKIEAVIWGNKYTGWFTESSVYGLGLYSHIEVIGNIYESPELLNE